jgi:hypothetical protein
MKKPPPATTIRGKATTGSDGGITLPRRFYSSYPSFDAFRVALLICKIHIGRLGMRMLYKRVAIMKVRQYRHTLLDADFTLQRDAIRGELHPFGVQ